MGEPVTNIKEFLEKYGTETVSLAVSRLIEKAPKFDGDIELARLLGEMMADLKMALRNAKQKP